MEKFVPDATAQTQKIRMQTNRITMTEPSSMTDFARALSRAKVGLNTRLSALADDSLSVIYEESNSTTLSNSRVGSPESSDARFNFQENPGHITQISKPVLQSISPKVKLPLSEGGHPMNDYPLVKMGSEAQFYGSEFNGFHKPYQIGQHTNPMQGIPQSQGLSNYQPSIVSQHQDLLMTQAQNCVASSQNYAALDQNYMPQAPYVNQGQNYMGPSQSHPSTSFNVAGFPQDQAYIDPSQNYPSRGLPTQGLSLGVPFENQGYSPTNSNSHGSEALRSKTPSSSLGQGHSFQYRYQRGGEHDQRQHQSNVLTGNQNDSLLRVRHFGHFNKQDTDKSKDVPSTPEGNQRNSQPSMRHHLPEVLQGKEPFNQVQLFFNSRNGAQVPDDQHVQSDTSVSVQGEGVQCASSEFGIEPSSVGPSNGNVSKVFVPGSEKLTFGTARSHPSKLWIDPVRGLPPPFLPGNASTRKISASSSNQGNGALISQYSHSDVANPNGAFGPYMGPQPIEFSGSSGPLVMAPTPRRSVLQSVYGVSPAASNPFSVSHHAPIKLQLAKRIWPSAHMAQISPCGAKPTLEVAFDSQNLPFMELGRRSCGVDHGVVRISNVPYHITRAEIVAFLGRNARIINENDEPVHIIMERVTSKTMDAYVEFINIAEAVNAVNRYEQNRAIGRPGRLGERHVDMELSSQGQLMADLFPKARNVRWNGSRPEIIPVSQSDPYNSGFQGFLIREELIMMVKHVETPSRSPFSRDCPQRPWECLISTLIKMPWYMTECITIDQRNLLYKTALFLVKNLNDRVNSEQEDLNINQRLLRRVLHACFRCAGFTEAQKDGIAFTLGIDPAICGLTIYADHWYPFNALGPKPGIAIDVMLYYMALLRDSTTSPALVSLGERSADSDEKPPCVFGDLKFEYPKHLGSCSLAYVAKLEWTAIDRLLRRVLPEN